MKYLRLIVLVGLVSLCSFASVHKFYLSLTKVNYVAKDNTLQITTELFIEDFQKVLRKRYQPEIILEKSNISEATNNYIIKYLEEKLSIKINDLYIHYTLLGIDYKEDKIVCYLEATNVPEISTFEVSNTLLFDMFSKQQNVVKLKVDDIEKSVLLIKGKDREQIVLGD